MHASETEYDVMLREIAMQAAFVRASMGSIVERARAAMADNAGRAVAGAIVIGCGDSFCAGLAARSYAMELTGVWIEPLEALEFSRYLVAHLPADRAVVGVSNSGTVARTVEGVRLARERGAWTFGVTVSAENDLARTAETLVRLETIPNIKQRLDGTKLVTPGTITYTASLLGVCGWAIALAAHNGTLDDAGVRTAIAAFDRVADWMNEADAIVTAIAPQLAATFARDRSTVIIGGGPNAATAYFAAAKWYEAMQWPAHHAEIEEWAHEQYFFTGQGTDTIAIVPPGGSHARGLEQLRAAREMGSRTIAIAERNDEAVQAAADVVIAMPAGIPEALTPFVYKLPFEYLAAHIAQQNGIDFFGFKNPLRQQVNFRQIFDSSQAPSAVKMSALLETIASGVKPMIGMIQLKPLPGGSRYAGEPLDAVLDHALRQTAILSAAGFPFLMVQNLGDLPTAASVSPPQVAWMTRITAEVQRTSQRPVGLNFLENDVDGMFAVASATGADFVRIKVYVGTMVTPGGVEHGRAFEAVRARTAWNATRCAIFADVHDRTGVPLASAGLADDIGTAFGIGNADGIVLTGRSHRETIAMLTTARASFPTRPILVGGGTNAANAAELMTLASGAIVSSALKSDDTLFGELEADKANAFMRAAARL